MDDLFRLFPELPKPCYARTSPERLEAIRAKVREVRRTMTDNAKVQMEQARDVWRARTRKPRRG